MLHHQNNNLLNERSLKSFLHLLHRIEHLIRDLQILIFLKNHLISIKSTPKISLTVFLGGCCLQNSTATNTFQSFYKQTDRENQQSLSHQYNHTVLVGNINHHEYAEPSPPSSHQL